MAKSTDSLFSFFIQGNCQFCNTNKASVPLTDDETLQTVNICEECDRKLCLDYSEVSNCCDANVTENLRCSKCGEHCEVLV